MNALNGTRLAGWDELGVVLSITWHSLYYVWGAAVRKPCKMLLIHRFIRILWAQCADNAFVCIELCLALI